MPANPRAEFRSLVVATVMVAVSVGALWLKWSLLPSATGGWSGNFVPVTAVLFTVGVMLAFSATLAASVRLRRRLQIMAGLSLAAMLVIPIGLVR